MTVRRVLGRSPDGRLIFGDVVGDLLRLDAAVAVIDARTGPVEVPVRTVAVAKLAPPSTADELALEAVAAQGWRAEETEQLGGWLLRANRGFTGRANSVLPLRAPGMPVERALERARSWYAERDLPLRFALPTEARRLLDADLAERGWPAEYEVHVLAGRLSRLHAPAARHDVQVQLTDRPDEQWCASYRDGAGTDPIAQALLTRHDAAAFASIRDRGQVLAIARGTIDEGWLGVTAVEVAPSARRQGLASTLMAALWRWGRDRDVTHSYLQVGAINSVAVAMYEGFGYWVHHDYRYRRDPQAPGS